MFVSVTRRSLLASGTMAAAAAFVGPSRSCAVGVEQAVPFSSGTAPPRSTTSEMAPATPTDHRANPTGRPHGTSLGRER